MRIEAVERMGYYPTPDRTESILGEAITMPTPGLVRLFDPCAGEGRALRRLADALAAQGCQVVTYGVEAQEERAGVAAQVLDHVLAADLFCTNISYRSFQVLLCNPPYDFNATEVDQRDRTERLEYSFLTTSTPLLDVGGLLIYIIPIYELKRDISEYLCKHYTNVQAYTLPPDEYTKYKQVVIFGYKSARELDGWEKGKILHRRSVDTTSIEAYRTTYTTEQIEKVLGVREYNWFSDLETAQTHGLLAASLQVQSKASSRDRVVFKQETIRPEEAIALYEAVGVHTTAEWRDATEPKKTYQIRPPAPLKTGHIAGVMASGEIGTTQIGNTILRGHVSRVTEWRNSKGEVVGEQSPDAEIETERIIPSVITLDLATGQTTVITEETALAEFLGQNARELAAFVQSSCKPRYEGATWAQWEAISQYALQKKYPGHAGGLSHSQKHVALATTSLLQAYRHAFLVGEQGTGKTVMAPATIAYLHSLTAKALPAWVLCPSHLVEKWKREIEVVVPGATALICSSISHLETARAQYHKGQKLFVIVSKEMAKLGPGWEHATVKRRARAIFPTCPTCGKEVPVYLGKSKQFCKECKAPLYTFTGLRRWPLADYARKKMKGFFKTLIADECHQYNGKSSDQARAYHHLQSTCRYTLNLTGTIMGGKATDLFWILYKNSPKVRADFAYDDEARWAAQFGRLERVYRATTTASGKFSGRAQTASYTRELPGTSPALYRYALESCIFLRVLDLGLPMPSYQETLQMIEPPKILSTQLTDADEAMKTVYGKRGANADAVEREDAQRMLGVRTQIMLGRPNSAFRSEDVLWTPSGASQRQPFCYPGTRPYTLHKLVEGGAQLPKEEHFVRSVLENLAEGRKSLVYVRQTGERDIQPRVAQLLRDVGVRAVILPEALEAKKREGWMRKHEADLDVLIVNPRKVETGLDLIAFSTIFCFEPELSPYSLWQALRRIWRPGQTQPCRVFFLVYNNTMEHKAVRTLLKRMGSVLLLYGDEPGGALATMDEGNMLLELTRAALKELDGESMSEEADATLGLSLQMAEGKDSIWLALPAPTRPAAGQVAQPAVLTLDESARLIWKAAMPPASSKRRKPIPAAQLSFLDLVAAAD